jgi:hypothetical protein
MAAEKKWQLNGDYFETCSCDVVCLCLLGRPTTDCTTNARCL